ncbi:MAG: SufD family Fe-S cluster assembly protein [Woeseiaceae bacterium]|nr:SufD family Fe-S cluster assembly protein [Woeseiaceae bacterium]
MDARSRPARRSPGSIPPASCSGDDSVGEFYSVARRPTMHQQADTGTKMVHIGKNTDAARIISKGISAGHVAEQPIAAWSRRHRKAPTTRATITQCDSMLIGDQCGAHTFPYIDVQNPTAQVEHEATTSQDQRGPAVLLSCSAASTRKSRSSLIVNGFCKEVFKELPMEFAVEAQALLNVSLEGAVG